MGFYSWPTCTQHWLLLLLFLVSCSSNRTTGCPGLPVCQPCMSQHHHPRSVGPAGVWVRGWSRLTRRFRVSQFRLRQTQLRICLHPEFVTLEKTHNVWICWPLSVSQYAILLTMVLTTFIKYLLHTIDLQSENPWDNKAVYMLYTELFTGSSECTCRVCPLMLVVT